MDEIFFTFYELSSDDYYLSCGKVTNRFQKTHVIDK